MKARITKRLAPIGYVAVDKRTAKVAYEQGIDVVLAGNNVNHFHIFDGWNLGCRINRKDYEGTSDANFEKHLNAFLFYLAPELGRYAVYYINRLPL